MSDAIRLLHNNLPHQTSLRKQEQSTSQNSDVPLPDHSSKHTHTHPHSPTHPLTRSLTHAVTPRSTKRSEKKLQVQALSPSPILAQPNAEKKKKTSPPPKRGTTSTQRPANDQDSRDPPTTSAPTLSMLFVSRVHLPSWDLRRSPAPPLRCGRGHHHWHIHWHAHWRARWRTH